eukprot:6202923-Pleurochrysis_carterae.AAC.1
MFRKLIRNGAAHPPELFWNIIVLATWNDLLQLMKSSQISSFDDEGYYVGNDGLQAGRRFGTCT